MWGKRKQGRNMSPMSYNDWDDLSDREKARRMKRHLQKLREQDPDYLAMRHELIRFLALALLLAALLAIAWLRRGM